MKKARQNRAPRKVPTSDFALLTAVTSGNIQAAREIMEARRQRDKRTPEEKERNRQEQAERGAEELRRWEAFDRAVALLCEHGDGEAINELYDRYYDQRDAEARAYHAGERARRAEAELDRRDREKRPFENTWLAELEVCTVEDLCDYFRVPEGCENRITRALGAWWRRSHTKAHVGRWELTGAQRKSFYDSYKSSRHQKPHPKRQPKAPNERIVDEL